MRGRCGGCPNGVRPVRSAGATVGSRWRGARPAAAAGNPSSGRRRRTCPAGRRRSSWLRTSRGRPTPRTRVGSTRSAGRVRALPRRDRRGSRRADGRPGTGRADGNARRSRRRRRRARPGIGRTRRRRGGWWRRRSVRRVGRCRGVWAAVDQVGDAVGSRAPPSRRSSAWSGTGGGELGVVDEDLVPVRAG